ncbi:MAG TPA: 6-phosphofructokinase [Thermoanaerobaculia bacterium]|nr:6-phosphofructokinase [Thermoanaerobaculia bacterium]
MAGKHIGVLTGGGDVPGLNAAIKSVYAAAKDHGWIRNGSSDANVTGILRGWKGVVNMARDPRTGAWTDVVPLDDARVRTVDRTGGTFLHTSRTRPDRMRPADLPARLRERAGELPSAGQDLVDATDGVIRNLTELGIDLLIAIGGDDTLGYAHTLSTRGFPVVGIPKTMDNDVRGTEYSLGFATAIIRAVEFINRQRTHLGSHEVIGVFRIFGRDAGFTALGTGMAISDIRCVIPEHAFDLAALCEVVAHDHAGSPGHYAMVLCSEGAIWEGGKLVEVGPPDAFGHRHKQNVGEALADAITRATGLPTRAQDLAYDLRSGDPEPFDKIIANTFGTLAVELAAQGKTGRMVCIEKGVYADTELPDPSRAPRTVDVASDYDVARFRPRFANRFGRTIFL